MKSLLTAFLILFGATLFAQLPSAKFFNKMKSVDGTEYSSVKQNGTDSITGKKIPLFIQTVTVDKDDSLYGKTKVEIEKLIHQKSYTNLISVNDDGNNLNTYFFDKEPNFEILIFTQDSEDNISLISYSAKDLSKSEKEQMKNMKISSN
ncbi:DUF4252 domain-containing protein [Rhizosphaericola mali]|uniref:DUF4252 domain-containing protein n=1 Tax=Rhizosphaericola mali TaxID=2545455 RepID=A0A5P2G1M6_9BACT|nr:DUF4252 domain-containing protein [Rhizosphaericola mali]QES89704.1 hypothetical protein E0W69_013880 [Rhizosphaericola mali]